MFERFTDEARQVVRLAQEEARRLRHPYIGTEHLLIAALDEGHGAAAQALAGRHLEVSDLRRRVTAAVDEGRDGLDPDALATLGIDLDAVRRVTEASFGEGSLDAKGRKPVRTGHIPFSKRAKKTLELALREALRLKHRHISSGHILLGLLRETDGAAALILIDAGIDLADLRDDVTRRIASEAA
jgi:ATP-dependent Clp protease ATP-binding subunit ClpA